MQTIRTYITTGELAALEVATLRAHLRGTPDAVQLATLLARIAPDNATTAHLSRIEQHAARISATLPIIEVRP